MRLTTTTMTVTVSVSVTSAPPSDLATAAARAKSWTGEGTALCASGSPVKGVRKRLPLYPLLNFLSRLSLHNHGLGDRQGFTTLPKPALLGSAP
mmetsp:Transcript_10707/g.27550  ORF Transcript_10707/g.27550 Transcript_10707/m.27550 type:complete len:94 (-) Transcript_10707:65-346(-)